MNKMVALWAHPRSRSTALERIFIERPDFEVFHEPFALTAFNKDSAIPHESLENDMPKTYEDVKSMLHKAREKKHVFHKDMCYHCLSSLLKDPHFLLEQENIFLIREPAATIASHYKIYPGMPCEAIGYKALYEVFCYLTKLTGKIPFVVNADIFAVQPTSTLKAICHHLHIPFIESAMQWKPGCPEQWLNWRNWHKDAECSSKIHAPSSSIDLDALESEPRLMEYYHYHRPFYERMNQFSIRGNT